MIKPFHTLRETKYTINLLRIKAAFRSHFEAILIFIRDWVSVVLIFFTIGLFWVAYVEGTL